MGHRREDANNRFTLVHFGVIMGAAGDNDLNKEVQRFRELLLSRSRSVHSAVI